MNVDGILKRLYYEALECVSPYGTVSERMAGVRSTFIDGGFLRLYAVAFGKSAIPMARAVEDSLGDVLTGGIAITKYGHVGDNPQSVFRIFEAAHPVPDENGLRAAREVMKLLDGLDDRTLLLCLISGGGSALLAYPVDGISLGQKQAVTGALLRAGATIGELNAVRKHLSAVKGGRLAGRSAATIMSLIISDVVGDDLSTIASGPTAPDSTTFSDAIEVLTGYGLYGMLAGGLDSGVSKYLEEGRRGVKPETPKPGDPVFERVRNLIVGNNKKALDAIAAQAGLLGIRAECLTSELRGEARSTARWLAEKAGDMARLPEKCLVLAGGETTVDVKGSGKGGRNTEFALAFAIEIDGLEGITLLSAGSDGDDAETAAAGAIVDGRSARRGRDAGLDPVEFLENNDSYTFFERTGGLFITGPTRVNVMDLQIVAINL